MGRADTSDRGDHQPGEPERLTGRGPVGRVTRGPALGAVLVVVAVLAGTLILRNLPSDTPGSSPSPSPSAEASPSGGPSPSAPGPTASPSEAPTPSSGPTPLPSVVITGDLPGPEATVPPGYVVMPVGIEEFAATAIGLGMV